MQFNMDSWPVSMLTLYRGRKHTAGNLIQKVFQREAFVEQWGRSVERCLREFARVADVTLQRVRLRPANCSYELFSSSTGRMAE